MVKAEAAVSGCFHVNVEENGELNYHKTFLILFFLSYITAAN